VKHWTEEIQLREDLMTCIRDILMEKGIQVTTVSPEETVQKAAAVLSRLGIGALPVIQDGALVGIISERDIAYSVGVKGVRTSTRKVRELMSGNPKTCSPEEPVEEVLERMNQRRIRHLPVMEGDKLAGIVSIRDLVRVRLGAALAEADQLREYIQN